MNKKLYYQFSDGADVCKIVLELDGIMEWIKADMEDKTENDTDIEYTIEPIWFTDEEFNKLHEANI